MPYVSLDGLRLHYRIDGCRYGQAPWLVLAHPLGSDLSVWAPQISALAKQFRVLRYDLRGHGQSDAPKGPYSIKQLIGDLLGLLDTLEISHTHFCGLSMSGLLGIACAARQPHRIQRLILANTAARIGSAEIWIARAEDARSQGLAALADTVLPRWFTADFSAREPLVLAAARDVFIHTDPEGYASNCEAINSADLRAELPRINTRVLVIAGTHDRATPAAQGRELAAAIPNARYLEFNAAHLSNLEQAVLFTSAAVDFLTA